MYLDPLTTFVVHQTYAVCSESARKHCRWAVFAINSMPSAGMMTAAAIAASQCLVFVVFGFIRLRGPAQVEGTSRDHRHSRCARQVADQGCQRVAIRARRPSRDAHSSSQESSISRRPTAVQSHASGVPPQQASAHRQEHLGLRVPSANVHQLMGQDATEAKGPRQGGRRATPWMPRPGRQGWCDWAW